VDTDTFLWPEGGVVHYTFECVDTLPIGKVALSGEAGRDDQESTSVGMAVLGLDSLFPYRLVIFGADYRGVERNVSLDIEDFVYMFE
jgi:hypothetical protein